MNVTCFADEMENVIRTWCNENNSPDEIHCSVISIPDEMDNVLNTPGDNDNAVRHRVK